MIFLEYTAYWIGWTCVYLAPTVVGVWLTYYLLSLPLRRQERASFFLDLVESALAAGHTPEQGLVSLSHTRDRSMGIRFHWLAALVESGQRLDDALGRVPGLLPPRLLGMVRAGLQLGDLRKVLPACRRVNSDARSSVFAGTNYVILVLMAMSPAAAGVLILLAVFVIPKFMAVFHDMGVAVPGLLTWLAPNSLTIAVLLGSLCAFTYLAAVLYVGGPHFARGLGRFVFPWADRLTWGLPWKRRQLVRDFGTVLAVLLDSGVPEPEALRLAAEATGNEVVTTRAEQTRQELERGRSLAEALQPLDPSGELQWRLRNASASRAGFLQALRGWLEALDAQAFQLEQVAAQGITTTLVLLNGVLVGMVVIAVFLPMIAIVEGAVLW